MYFYNISVIVEEQESQAVKSILLRQLALARSQGSIVRLLELLDSPHEGVTYSIQLEAETTQVVDDFQAEHLAYLHSQTNQYHPGKVFFFDSLMRKIS